MSKLSRPLLIDSLGATLFVFLGCGLLKLIVFNSEFMDPIQSILHHVEDEFSNLVYDNTRARIGTAASDLCLIDVGKANRTKIAGLLNAVADQQPRLVAVDIMFDKKNMAFDTTLQRALKRLQQQQKLVMASWVSIEGKKGAERIHLQKSDVPYQMEPTGYTNFVAEEINGVVRHHLPQLKLGTGKTAVSLSFAAQIVLKAAPKTWQAYERHQAAMGRHEPDWILYQNDQTIFSQLDINDLNKGSERLAELTDKIVLVGLVNGIDDPYDPGDTHLVPLGDEGRMRGLQIHANIIAMLLDGTHLHKVATWIVWLIAFPICWLLIIFLMRQSHQEDIRSMIVARIVQLGLVASIILIALLFFYFQHIELSTLPLLIPIALAADGLLFYEGLICWFSSRKWLFYKSFFTEANVYSKKTASKGHTRVHNAPTPPRG